MDIEDLNKEGNPYPHVEDRETQDVKGYFSSPITSENLLGEVEKNRANPHTVTITCEDERSMKFAEIAASIKVTPDKTHFNAPHLKSDILILSDGKIIGGEGYDLISPPPFMVGVVKKGYFLFGYIETTSFGIAPRDTMDEVEKFNPVSRWAFDILTKYVSDFDDRPEECWQLGTFFEDMIVKRLWLRCKELIQVDPLLGPLFTGEEYQRNDEAIRALEDYIGSIDLLHIPPPEEWETSLKDILISQMAGDVLEERDRDKEFIDKLLGKSH